MLSKVLAAAWGSLFRRENTEILKQQAQASIKAAHQALGANDVRSAISHFRAYLESEPHDHEAINDLGYCYAKIGDTTESARLFDQAYALNSTYLPGVTNHAKILADRQRSEEALPLLLLVKAQNPDYWNTDIVMAAVRQARGEVAAACRHSRDAWFKNFDELRLANNYLFNCCYADIPESTLTAEHRFWAATVSPLLEEFRGPIDAAQPVGLTETSRRIRIGYWSPDLRKHSVFFFAHPLIANHDRTAFEVFIYHDTTSSDEQTKCIRQQADAFHETALLADADLFRLMRSHRLDVLIEFAGHTSSNRITMLQGRLAKVQLTGLGYPPTTGLDSLDGKLLDVHVCPNPSFDRFYAEASIRLPESFWSFDPHWEAQRLDGLPCDKTGGLTYGCFGNISKITDELLSAWSRILWQVPDSCLLIRSISFRDSAALDAFRQRVSDAGIPGERCELRGPVSGHDFLNAYNEVDVVLDTYPFNGGTTSCFALFMGALVVSCYGEGLRSRMGLSMLNNLGLGHWAADSLERYVELAVLASQSRDELREFRRTAGERFKSTALGDGQRFCRQVEAACRDLLAKAGQPRAPAFDPPHLPVQEIMRRAYMVYRHGNAPAARRIASYCLQLQADCIPAHLLLIEEGLDGHHEDAAVERLQALIRQYPRAEDISAAHLMLTRLLLAHQRSELFGERLRALGALQIQDAHDQAYAAMLMAWLSHLEAGAAVGITSQRPVRLLDSWTLVVESPDSEEFEHFVTEVRQHFPQALGSIRFEYCRSAQLSSDLARVLSSLQTSHVALTQSNVRLASMRALSESAQALQSCDLVSFGGCVRWDRVAWRRSAFTNKLLNVIVGSSESGVARHEVRKAGQHRGRQLEGLSLLDGSWIAFRSDWLQDAAPDALEFSMELDGAAGMMFEEWSHRQHQAGRRLLACQTLGVTIVQERPVCVERTAEASLYLTERYGFDPFADLEEDSVVLGIPVADLAAAELAQIVMFQDS